MPVVRISRRRGWIAALAGAAATAVSAALLVGVPLAHADGNP